MPFSLVIAAAFLFSSIPNAAAPLFWAFAEEKTLAAAYIQDLVSGSDVWQRCLMFPFVFLVFPFKCEKAAIKRLITN